MASVVVTAADGVATKTYTVHVVRRNPESDKLSALGASGLSFTFSPETRTYSLNAPNALSSTTVSATAELSGSTIEISIDGGTTFDTFDSSAVVGLTVGLNAITLRVNREYAGDPGSSFYYTVSITRAASGPSSDASLSGLTLGGGSIALSPVFATGTFLYTATAPSWVSNLSVTPTTTVSGAVAVVTGNGALSYGANTIVVTVTAADGTTQLLYRIDVTRLLPPSITIANHDDGDSIPVGTITVSGTYDDPNDEIDHIVVFMSGLSSPEDATFSGGTFSVSIDAGSMTNGTKRIVVLAADSFGGAVCSDVVDIVLTGGATGYSVSLTASLSDGATTTSGYLTLVLDTDYVIILDMPLDAISFPYDMLVEGVTNGQHSIDIYITDAPTLNATGFLYQGGTETFGVSGADYDAGSIILTRM
jgi:hypothetical protein